MNIVSYSVWGTDPLYLNGAIANAKLVPDMYKGFTARFYCDESSPASFIDELKGLQAQVVLMQNKGEPYTWEGLFWRFLAFEETGIVLIRDIDSRITSREVSAVNEWLNSTYQFHTMRDHIEHSMPILGGMFGCKNGLLQNINELLGTWHNFNTKGCDQEFLRDTIWPMVINTALAHDKYPRGKKIKDYEYSPIGFFGEHAINPFPYHDKMEFGTHVGEIIREST